MKMTEDQLRAITDAEMRVAVGYYTGKLGAQRQKAMAYYLGKPTNDLTPPEIEGRSSVVSPDVRNTIEAMLPQLMVKFAGGDNVVEFEATKPGEELKAQQATDYVNYVYHVKNPGERITYTWLKDALLSKNGIVKVWWDDRSEQKREEYEGLDEWELAQIMDDDEVEVTEQKAYPDEEDIEQRQKAVEQLTKQLTQAQQAAQQNPQAAQAVQQLQQQIDGINAKPQKLLFDITCVRTKDVAQVRVENVPPEEFLISRKAKDMQSAPFVGHRIQRTISELKSQGYKNLDNIAGDENANALNLERIERLGYDDELAYLQSDTSNNLDDSARVIWVTECYIRVDFDGDGIAELRKVVRAGNQILENEVVDMVPFVDLTPVPMPHKFFGLSVADLAMEGQKINTALLRGVLDNTYLQINGRYFAVEGQVNLDDLLTSRPGGIVRVKQAGAAGRLDQGAGDSQLGMGMLEYMKQFQEDSTGWSRNSAGTDTNALNSPISATQATIVTNKADMRLDLIARNMAEGFRQLFRMILKLCSQKVQKEQVVKLRGEWVECNPRDWRNGFECSINVGLGTGNKDQQVAHMMALLAQQQFGLQVGTATPQNVFESQKELVRALGYKSADKFFTDPSKAPPRPPPPNPDMIKAQTAQQLKQMELQADAQRFQAEMSQKAQEIQAQHQAKMAEIQANFQLQQSNDQRDAEREQLRAQLDAQLKAQEQATAERIAQMNNEIAKYKADLDAQTRLAIAGMSQAPQIDLAPVHGAIQQVMEHLSAPVEIVRDQVGRAVGVKRGESVRQIKRGPDGRAIGVQ